MSNLERINRSGIISLKFHLIVVITRLLPQPLKLKLATFLTFTKFYKNVQNVYLTFQRYWRHHDMGINFSTRNKP